MHAGKERGGVTMRAIIIAAALLGCLSGPGSAYDLETRKGQAICDTLAEFEELSIAIGMGDDPYIEEMGTKGCHFPEPGLRISLIEAYADQTVLLFRKLAENTRLGAVPERIEELTNLAKVRLLYRDRDPMIGFTLLPVPHSPDGKRGWSTAN
jgi:hypothetical protein